MKTLHELTAGICDDADEREINAIIYDSRKVCEGCLYIAIKGARFDGHSAIAAAAEAKAAAVLAQYADEQQKEICKKNNCALLITNDTRRALALCSAAFFGQPAKELVTIGITGTKGKSTVAFMVKSIMEELGYKCGLIGTVEVDTSARRIPSVNTTPESYELQSYLREMCDAGCRAVVMEVSSQGLMMHRTDGIHFNVGVFTNLSPDHIGPNEHKDFDDYLRCKSLLFKNCRVAAVNSDDEHTDDILDGNRCDELIRFGFSEHADMRAICYRPGECGGQPGTELSFSYKGKKYHMTLPFPGRFSVYNIMSAIAAVCAAFGDDEEISTDRIIECSEKSLKHALIKGRMELLPVSDEYSLMIDYAHNAMALESLLSTLRDYCSGRLITLFGCGGNRAKSRRYEMGEVSGRLSDLTVITSDNPRDEEPLDIIADIEAGISRTDGKHITVADRREAIACAMHEAKRGDIVILAGKGHEDYQEIKGVKHHMDERELVYGILKDDGNKAAMERMRRRYPYLEG